MNETTTTRSTIRRAESWLRSLILARVAIGAVYFVVKFSAMDPTLINIWLVGFAVLSAALIAVSVSGRS